jgi:hypothetical protein
MTWRRIKLYLIGFGLGTLLCIVLFRGRDLTGCTPTRRVTTLIATTKSLSADSSLLCEMKCQGITLDDVRKAIVAGEVDFDKSQPRKEPAHEYLVNVNVKGKQLGMYFSTNMVDSTVHLLMVNPKLNGDSCGCK